jgi:hypothetical protein
MHKHMASKVDMVPGDGKQIETLMTEPQLYAKQEKILMRKLQDWEESE